MTKENKTTDGQQPDTTDNSRGLENGKFIRGFSQALQDLALLLGPATLIGIVGPILGISGRVTAEVSITVFLISTILFFASSLKRRLHIALPACLSVILAAVLIHLLLEPAKEIIVEDKWVTWEHQVKEAVGKCNSEDKAFNICIASAISREYPKSNSNLATDLLYDDIRAGTILMHIEPVRKLLKDSVGIRENFLGNGFAKPIGEGKLYCDARIPEYLVVNHNDVWTWELSPVPQQLNRKLIDIIGSQKDSIMEISGRNGVTFSSFFKTVGDNLSLLDETPAVVRFGRFPRRDDTGKEIYSHKMGRSEAKRVFVLHLGPVYNLTLDEAAKLSGYSLDAQQSNHDKLWVWVYLPSDPRDITRPTWHEISLHLKDWLMER
jgi:hypothetical protein